MDFSGCICKYRQISCFLKKGNLKKIDNKAYVVPPISVTMFRYALSAR